MIAKVNVPTLSFFIALAYLPGSEPARAADDPQPQNILVCTPIKTAQQLSNIRNNLSGTYCLEKDIDLSTIPNFVPIEGLFTGRLYGKNHAIRNLSISSSIPHVGLFESVSGAIIRDLSLDSVSIIAVRDVGGLVGGLAGTVENSTITRVSISGKIKLTCTSAGGANCFAGGMAGQTFRSAISFSYSSAAIDCSSVSSNGAADRPAACGGLLGWNNGIVQQSHATGSVVGGAAVYAGGLVGQHINGGGGSTVLMSYATGPIATGDGGVAGGLVGLGISRVGDRSPGVVEQSYATGPVFVGNDGWAGGLVGFGGRIARSFAAGSVEGRISSRVGGLTSTLTGNADQTLADAIAESYAIGRVRGGTDATLGGLFALALAGVTAFDSYWDIQTTGQTVSAGGTGLKTGQLRSALPAGFGSAWWFTKAHSYPFLNDPDFRFTAPLATLVKSRRAYIFLPIDQHDAGQYGGPSSGANLASLAAVYTMIARAIGITRNVAALKDAKIDTYFWDDATKTATWQGPVTTRATLGAFVAIAPGTALNDSNVIGAIKSGQLVMLRATYTKANGNSAQHWLLATLFTSQGRKIGAVVANDPWTGEQVVIDPATKKIVSDTDFPLANLEIDGYQPVTLN